MAQLSRCAGSTYQFQFVNMTGYPVQAQYLRQYNTERTLPDGTPVFKDPLPYATSVAGDSVHNSITVHPYMRGTAFFVPSPNTPAELNKVVLAFFQVRAPGRTGQSLPRSLAWEAAQSMRAAPNTVTSESEESEFGRLALQYLQFDTATCEFKVMPTATTAQGFGVRHTPSSTPGVPMTFVLYDGPVSQGPSDATPWVRIMAFSLVAAMVAAAAFALYWVRAWYRVAMARRDKAGALTANLRANATASALARTRLYS